MAHQTTIVTRTQHDSSAGSPFPCVFLKLKKASCPIPVHYRSATRPGGSPPNAERRASSHVAGSLLHTCLDCRSAEG
eukprot:7072436-Prymnesium_polylepis.1